MLDYDVMSVFSIVGERYGIVYPEVLHIPLRLLWEYTKRARYMEQLDMYKLELQLSAGIR